MMKILSEDKKRLNQLRELLDSHGEISTHGLAKSHFDQSVIDNTFVEDFDGDDKITKADYLICSNWLLQGKPHDVEKYNKDRGFAPHAVKLPTSRLVPVGGFFPSNARIQNTEVNIEVDLTAEHTSDFDQDGRVTEKDRDILAGYCLQGGTDAGPTTSGEYNLNRVVYPSAGKLPNKVTANYTCNVGECCDDDYTSDGKLSSKDALVYYAWSSLIDWSSKPEETSDIDYYNEMAPPGFKFSPTKFPIMPCADFDGDGSLSSNDALVYYAWASRIDWSKKPSAASMGSYYSTMSPRGFRFTMNHAPVCADGGDDDECMGTDEMCLGLDAAVNWTDFLILYKWLKEEKCETIECYNEKREEYPEACKIPFELYESIGANIQEFEEVYIGIENL
jgi:hypothetical protein